MTPHVKVMHGDVRLDVGDGRAGLSPAAARQLAIDLIEAAHWAEHHRIELAAQAAGESSFQESIEQSWEEARQRMDDDFMRATWTKNWPGEPDSAGPVGILAATDYGIPIYEGPDAPLTEPKTPLPAPVQDLFTAMARLREQFRR